ncbi:MAG: hypothetical protein ABSG42_06070 [Nitrospirota bacterium]
MKVPGITKFILCLLAIGIAFLSGAYLGHKNGIKQANYFLTTVPTIGELDAIDLKNEITNLKYLRAGQINSSINMLEFLADNDISYLGIRLKDAVYTPQQKKQIKDIESNILIINQYLK